MRCAACALLLGAVSFGLLGSIHAGGDKKKPTEPPKERLYPAGNLLGEILEASDGGKTLKLRIHTKVPDIKFNGMQRGYRPGQPPPGLQITAKDSHQDIDIVLADDVKVRIPLRPEYDEKGKIKPESLRPDPKDPDKNLGGSKGSEKDLKRRQWVTVVLGATRDRPPKVLATVVIVVADPPEPKN